MNQQAQERLKRYKEQELLLFIQYYKDTNPEFVEFAKKLLKENETKLS